MDHIDRGLPASERDAIGSRARTLAEVYATHGRDADGLPVFHEGRRREKPATRQQREDELATELTRRALALQLGQ